MKGRVLIVDDDADMCEVLVERMEGRGYGARYCTRGDEALRILRDHHVDVVITDLNMPGMTGIEFCQRIVDDRPSLPVIVITAFGSLDTAVAAIRAGAYDFLTKPVDIDELTIAVDRGVERRRLKDEVERLRRQVERPGQLGEMIGQCAAMRELFTLVERVATTSSSVLVVGESGTGKELVARAIHRRSERRERAFVAVNCAALPENLLESVLFGHVRGAFTDAREDKEGLFVQADGGTLFLDEVGDLPLSLQPKLLRVLEEQQVRPVGGERPIDIDVRIVAATHRDLEAAVQRGEYREDLFFRLDVIELNIPPLRERGRDILLLAQHFVEHFAGQADRQVVGLNAEAGRALMQYDWPGNIRELRNYMERAVVLAVHKEITPEDLPPKVRSARRARPQKHNSADLLALQSELRDGGLPSIKELEARYIAFVLGQVRGNKSEAAQILGFDRTTLYRKIDRYEIDVDSLLEQL